MKASHTTMFDTHDKALRDPLQIVSASFEDSGISNASLNFRAQDDFTGLLNKLKITLLVSREYEHLLVALQAGSLKLEQSVFPLPHPSGIAVNKKDNSVYVASTRNPNAIFQFKITRGQAESKRHILMPARVKYYPGSYYFHDLAVINDKLYANSVGKNGIIEIDFSSPATEELCWWPRCVELKNKRPDTSANFIQLNSIAAGNSLKESCFTASGSGITRYRPGHVNYPVNKTGVVFSGETREVMAAGLTRPHSAKIYKNKIWLNNSGYGEFGFIDQEKFIPVVKLPGWTRGLCIYKNVAFVGVSRILPRFRHYAPGVTGKKQECAIYAVSLKTGEIMGKTGWAHGNQVFAIDCMNSSSCHGFLFKKRKSAEREKNIFYKYHY